MLGGRVAGGRLHPPVLVPVHGPSPEPPALAVDAIPLKGGVDDVRHYAQSALAAEARASMWRPRRARRREGPHAPLDTNTHPLPPLTSGWCAG